MSKKEIDATEAGLKYAMQMLEKIPKDNMQASIEGVLIVFWGALWGTYGTEFARGFIESQLRGMESEGAHERFTKPSVQ